MSSSQWTFSVRGLMSSGSNNAPGHPVRPGAGDRPSMFDDLRKQAKRHERQREQQIDSRVQEQRERQLRAFRRTGR